MVAREQRLLVISALLSSAVLMVGAVAGFEELLAFATPGLVLALPLLAGRYLGEERIVRAASRRRRPPVRPRSASVPRVWLRAMRTIVRGGRLIAESLAVRPPPAVSVR
jgi:hypothetical protein